MDCFFRQLVFGQHRVQVTAGWPAHFTEAEFSECNVSIGMAKVERMFTFFSGLNYFTN